MRHSELAYNRITVYSYHMHHTAFLPNGIKERLTADPAAGRLTANLFFLENGIPSGQADFDRHLRRGGLDCKEGLCTVGAQSDRVVPVSIRY